MRLFLCEKPSQGRDIAGVLGATKREDGFLSGSGMAVTWGIGHLLETAPPDAYDAELKSWRLESLPILPDDWRMVVKAQTAAQFKVVKALLGKADEVVIATDADREGEMIARELMDFCGYRGKVSRLWLSALNEASIKKALASLKDGKETFPLYHSALGRSRADWLIGMNLSRLFTLLGRQAGYEGVLSVGRVQTPTLKLVVDRERTIQGFVPKPYWTLKILLNSDGVSFGATWEAPEESADDQGRCVNEAAAKFALAKITAVGTAIVQSVETKRVKVPPPLPFELSQLQSVCSASLGLGAQKTLEIAQSLYEKHKATSYPRTDCSYLPESMLADVPKVLDAIVKTEPAMKGVVQELDLSLKSRAWNEAKVAEAAHHGIIPTNEAADISAMTREEALVYNMIRFRYLAQFRPPHEYDQTNIVLDCGGQRLHAAGRKVMVQGWKSMVSDDEESEDSQALPLLVQDARCAISSAEVVAKTTTPPPYFTEGTLITAMKNVAKLVADERLKAKLKETTGIGTNATRASIIQGLIDRGFIVKKKSALTASDAARTLIDAVPEAVSSPGTTAIWEQALDLVEKGQLTLDDFLDRQKKWIRQMVEKYQGATLNIKGIKVSPAPACPECGAPMKKRKGQKSEFWGCSKYPDCRGMQWIDNGKKKARKATKRVKKSS